MIFRLAAPYIGNIVSETTILSLFGPIVVNLLSSIVANARELGVELSGHVTPPAA